MRYNTIVNTKIVSTDIKLLFKEYAMNIKKKSLKDLRGKIKFREDYDYKLMREKV